jgi:hypothetical protein
MVIAHDPSALQPAPQARKENGMKDYTAPENQVLRRILLIAWFTALAVAFTASLPRPTHAAPVTPPPVPAEIQVPAGNKLFMVGHASGTQNYICLPSGTGVKFVLFTPQATLFSDDGGQVTTHFFSPNPEQGGTMRPAWQHSRDSSTVWGAVEPGHSATVSPDALAWLLLTAVGDQAGPTGGDRMTATTYIQRLNTTGGLAPSTGCSSSGDVGNQAYVPYTADYYFYKKTS